MMRGTALLLGTALTLGFSVTSAEAQIHVDVGVITPSVGARVVLGAPRVHVVERYYEPVYNPYERRGRRDREWAKREREYYRDLDKARREYEKDRREAEREYLKELREARREYEKERREASRDRRR
jgi:hypothetical protein